MGKRKLVLQQPPPLQLLHTYEAAAQALSVSVPTIRRLVEQKQLERVYVGKRGVRITDRSLRSYIDKLARNSNPPTNDGPRLVELPTKKDEEGDQ
jgi:excisionase family DNA binding protein